MSCTPWWVRPADTWWPRDLDTPEAVADAIRWLRSAEEPHWLERAGCAVREVIRAALDERDAWLAEVACAHAPDTLRADERVGIPLPVVAAWCGLAATPASPVPGPEPDAPAAGCRRGQCVEWWGVADQPGARYGEHLAAWGYVAEQLGVVDGWPTSPRLAWAPAPGRWAPHPRFSEQAHHDPLPVRLDAGPGLLLACLIDALVEVARAVEEGSAPLTGRECAALFGVLLLPLLAPTTGGAAPPRPGELPDYVHQLAFHLLHPRARLLVLLLDRVETWRVTSDDGSAAAVLACLGRATDRPWDALDAVLDEVAEDLLHRKAGPRWDSGLGFKLVRSLVRDLRGGQPLDDLLHGPSPQVGGEVAVGRLAHRLRACLQTAVAFSGRPVHADGPAVQQVADLARLRWSDDSFLADARKGSDEPDA